MRTAFIYTLADPQTGAIRYVGKTFNLRWRYSAHLRDATTCHKRNWLKSMLPNKPTMEVLETITSEKAGDWEDAERFWIENLRQLGFPLTNMTTGGESGRALSAETRSKMSQARKGHVKSAAWRQKLRESNVGQVRPEHVRIKMRKPRRPGFGAEISKRMRGYKHSNQARLNMKASKQNMPLEWRRKIGDARRGKKNPKPFGWVSPLKGVPKPDHVKEKLRQANLGRRPSDETRRKMSEKQTLRWARERAQIYQKLGYSGAELDSV